MDKMSSHIFPVPLIPYGFDPGNSVLLNAFLHRENEVSIIITALPYRRLLCYHAVANPFHLIFPRTPSNNCLLSPSVRTFRPVSSIPTAARASDADTDTESVNSPWVDTTKQVIGRDLKAERFMYRTRRSCFNTGSRRLESQLLQS